MASKDDAFAKLFESYREYNSLLCNVRNEKYVCALKLSYLCDTFLREIENVKDLVLLTKNSAQKAADANGDLWRIASHLSVNPKKNKTDEAHNG